MYVPSFRRRVIYVYCRGCKALLKDEEALEALKQAAADRVLTEHPGWQAGQPGQTSPPP